MTVLTTGVPKDLASGEIVALPGRAGRLLVSMGTAASLGFSNSADMTGEATQLAATFKDAGAYAQGIDVSGGFIQANGGTATVRWVPY